MGFFHFKLKSLHLVKETHVLDRSARGLCLQSRPLRLQLQQSNFLKQFVVHFSVTRSRRLAKLRFYLVWPKVGEAVRTFCLAMLGKEVLLLQPLLKLVLAL